MGCTQSRLDNEEAVQRCRERKLFMKDAVSFRNAFAAAHSAYAMSLKNTGAALHDFASAEIPQASSSSAAAAAAAAPALTAPAGDSAPQPPPPPSSEMLPPPPPLPVFGAGDAAAPAPAPLQRAVTMPEMKIQKPDKGRRTAGPAAIVEEGEEVEMEESERLVRKKSGRGVSNRGSGGSNRGSGISNSRSKEKEPTPAHVVQHDSTWDYFFPPMESVPGPTLADPVLEEEEKVEKVRSSKGVVAHDDDDDDDDEEEEEEEEEVEAEVEEAPPVVVKEEKAVEIPVPVVEKNVVKRPIGGNVGSKFMQIFVEIDDHFLKASESAHDVSKMLEATRLHYHSNFADNRGI